MLGTRDSARVVSAAGSARDASVSRPRSTTREAFYVTPTGATSCVGAAAVGGDEIVVFIDHTSDAGERCSIFVPLDAHGHRHGDSELRVQHPSPYLGTIVGVGAHAVVTLSERQEERFTDRSELRQHDRLSLVEIVTPRGMQARTVGSWDDLDIAHACVTSHGEQTAWTMRVVSYLDGTRKTSLAYAYGRGVELPTPHKTDVGCSIVTHTVRDSGMVALLGTSQALSLWLLPPSGTPRSIVEGVT